MTWDIALILFLFLVRLSSMPRRPCPSDLQRCGRRSMSNRELNNYQGNFWLSKGCCEVSNIEVEKWPLLVNKPFVSPLIQTGISPSCRLVSCENLKKNLTLGWCQTPTLLIGAIWNYSECVQAHLLPVWQNVKLSVGYLKLTKIEVALTSMRHEFLRSSPYRSSLKPYSFSVAQSICRSGCLKAVQLWVPTNSTRKSSQQPIWPSQQYVPLLIVQPGPNEAS